MVLYWYAIGYLSLHYSIHVHVLFSEIHTFIWIILINFATEIRTSLTINIKDYGCKEFEKIAVGITVSRLRN